MQQTGLCENFKTVSQGEARVTQRKNGGGIVTQTNISMQETQANKRILPHVMSANAPLGNGGFLRIAAQEEGEPARRTCLRSHKENHPLRVL